MGIGQEFQMGISQEFNICIGKEFQMGIGHRISDGYWLKNFRFVLVSIGQRI